MKGRQRVLHLVSSGGVYGAERVILNLSKEQKMSSFEAILGVISHKGEEPPKVAMEAQSLGINISEITLVSRFDLTGMLRMGKMLKKEDIGIVHSHGYKATSLAFLPCFFLGIPLIVTCHLWFTKGNFKLRVYTEIEALIMRILPAVIAVSEDIREDIVRKGVSRNKVHVIHNGIDLTHYPQCSAGETAQLFESVGIQKNDILVGTIGRLNDQKAHHYLIEAMKNIVDRGNLNIKCMIIGEGKLKAKLVEQCKDLELEKNVFLTGYRKDISNILERFDIFVLTSIDEGLPMVLLEAMALKKAIITTPVGAIKNVIINNDNGLLYEIGDVQSLADYISILKENSVKRKDLGENAYSTFRKEYTSKIMARKYMDLYNSLL